MGFLLYPQYAGLFNTTPTKVVVINGIKYLYDISLIPYFVFCLSFLNRKIIRLCVGVFMSAWILFGCFQIAAFYIDNPVVWKIYDSLDFLKVIGGTSETFQRIKHNYGTFRFYGFAVEPAGNCVLIAVLLLPFLIMELKEKHGWLYSAYLWVSLVFTVFFAIMTKSASVFSGMAILGVVALVNLFRDHKTTVKFNITLVSLCVGGLAVILLVPQLREIFFDRFLLKLFDKSDYSTQHRYSTIWNDFNVFIRNPIFGVGDGNQGYFYTNNVLGTWMANNPETQSALKGERGLLNGGAAIPSLISGFGIFGCVLLYVQGKKYYVYTSSRNRNFSKFSRAFAVGLIVYLFLCSATIGIHRNYLLFLFFATVGMGANSVPHFKDIYGVLESESSCGSTSVLVNVKHLRIDV